MLEGTAGATIGTLSTIDPDGGNFTYVVGSKFHNYYCFGAVDANAAVTAYTNYVLGSLGSPTSKSSTSAGTLNTTIAEGSSQCGTIGISTSGIVEYV